MDEKTKNTEQVLASEILAEAKARADESLRAAQAEAKSTVEKAVAEAEKARAAALAEVDARVARDKDIAEAGIEHLRRKQRLVAQGKLIDEAFDQALSRLGSKQGFDNRAVLRDLAVDAIAAIPGDAFTLVLAPGDAALGVALASDVAAAVSAKAGRPVTVKVAPAPGAFEGGVIVESADGSQRVDNSFAGRLRRLEGELRFEVADVLFGKDK